eukprot:CAMPEP_0115261242 /NCGR_PEP_ID=MMETSP0270-20121206/48760_1 /TAXON_ID=71861 /ORGANISM="Scrippsiella trochoidea, Strain CCMP3099" /LENGTH=143 /DNA_ID=CAMNT_0002677119 /DNA_START=77 /DNA_END=505 /DNA_ORIENTATION=+
MAEIPSMAAVHFTALKRSECLRCTQPSLYCVGLRTKLNSYTMGEIPSIPAMHFTKQNRPKDKAYASCTSKPLLGTSTWTESLDTTTIGGDQQLCTNLDADPQSCKAGNGMGMKRKRQQVQTRRSLPNSAAGTSSSSAGMAPLM